MATLDGHGGKWLRDDAAVAFNRMQRERGRIGVNSAGRSVAEQNKLIARWRQGGPANRPPNLYEPANPPERSNHVRGGGLAFDTSDWRRVKEFAHLYGFKWYGNADVVHFDYVGGGSAPASGSQEVKNQQAWLNQSRGAGLAVDGLRGPKTIQAFKNYQTFLRGYGYKGAIDGVWGGGTQNAHQAYYNAWHASSAAPSGYPRGSFKEYQAALNRFGYNLAVDGQWGTKSSNALADFQRKRGLVVDRIVGPKTRAALGI